MIVEDKIFAPNTELINFLASFTERIDFSRKIVLIHCPTFNFETFQPEVLRNRGYYAYPPRALQCLAAAVADMGVKADILDLNYLLLKKLMSLDLSSPVNLYDMLTGVVDAYFKNNPGTNIFGVSTGVIVPNIFLAARHPFLEVLKHLKNNYQGLILAGGPCATIEAKNLVEGRWAHAVFKGEAEDRLCYLLRLLFGEQDLQPYSGICFLDGGNYAETAGSNAMVDFGRSIIDTYQTVRVEEYHKVGCLSPFSRMVGPDEPFATIQLIRGCRMRCSFCGLTQYRGSNKVCCYPSDLLFKEIEFLVKERGIKHLSWVDEDLLADRQAFAEILRRIIDAHFDITWSAPIGIIAVFLDDEILRLMAQSGCIGFRIGIESGNEEILLKIKKPATKKGLRAISQRLQSHPEFFVCGLYMLGFEGETYGQMFDTFKFALEMDLSWAHCTVYQEIKGAESSAVACEENKAMKKAGCRDWLPSAQKIIGSSKIISVSRKNLTAREVFGLPLASIHDPAIRQDLWFAFNLVVNYMCNKNLRPGENVDHFIRWTSGLQATYSDHPVISLFLSLAFLVRGDKSQADTQFKRTLCNLEKSETWLSRFGAYDLNKIIEAYPLNGGTVSDFLLDVVKGYQPPFSVDGYRRPAVFSGAHVRLN
ncbi:MAG: B12-binding domain-containing radical SAM protein [Elusimicrobia bacterium]|nr:B12-binding domain-containing radical SAM protein [Elusimicrobiota bacterium]